MTKEEYIDLVTQYTGQLFIPFVGWTEKLGPPDLPLCLEYLTQTVHVALESKIARGESAQFHAAWWMRDMYHTRVDKALMEILRALDEEPST
jgi:hypothetical protein